MSVEEEILDTAKTQVNWAAQYLEELIIRFDTLFYSLQIDPNFIDVVEQQNNSLSIIDIQKTLISTYYAHSRVINKLELYVHSTGEEISADALSSGLITYPDIRSGKWISIINGPVSQRIVAETDAVYAVHSINTFIDRKLLGGLAVEINSEIIDYVLEILRADNSGEVLLLNETGELIAGSSKSAKLHKYENLLNSQNKNSSETQIHHEDDSIILIRKLDRERITIIKTIPLNQIAASSRRVLTAGLFTSGILIIATLLISILFSLRISKPIIKLAKTMEQTSLLDFEHLKIENNDEIGLLEQGYNTLMSRMRDMVEKEYQREIDLRSARLNALHAQINPHFLYNTLHLIGGMALEKNSPEIYKISKAVGDLFRYNTTSEDELVSLDKELNHIRNYLMIQEMRFEGRCNIQYDIEDEIKNVLIPQFTLQPVVENAFEHGLQPKSGKWEITIRGKRQRRGILLVIEDNGIGMEIQQLKKQRQLLLEQNSPKKDSKSHIGLKNVDSRLKLQFGESYGLRIYSIKMRGTKVVFKLPDIVKEETDGIPGTGY